MRHGSLFSGIGGFDLAAQWMGWNNVFQVEWDGYCQKVLAKNCPNVKRYGDIKEFDGTKYKGAIDIISGGFPCQPFSGVGRKKGQSDDRYLWPEMLRVIREVRPTFIVGENVTTIISMDDNQIFDRILSDLENEGYQTEQFIIPACAIGAWHRRDRLWIFAYSDSERLEGRVVDKESDRGEGSEVWNDFAGCNREVRYLWNKDWNEVAPEFCRNRNGIPNRVDRLKGLGNAIVPQVAFQIFKAIEQYNNLK